MAHLLLVSDIKVKPDQLPTLPSPTTRTSSQFSSSQPATDSSSGFLLGNTSFGLGSVKTDLDGSGTNIAGVVGKGGAESTSEEPSLYGFLLDLFGESLCLRLTGHESLGASLSSTQGGEPSPPDQPAPSSKDIRSVNRSLVLFLSKEGFKPIRIDLPYYLPQPRPMHGRWTFSIPRFVLPVQGNVLEHGMRMGHMQHRGGVCTGTSPSYKRHSHRLRQSYDIGSVWI